MLQINDFLEASNIILVSVILFTVPFVFCFSYKKIRPKFPARVTCWFCDFTTTVPFGNKNCWDCLSCEQYNGFKEEDGDYNKPIPAQFNEDLNYPVIRASGNGQTSIFRSNGLCNQCNINQAVKVKLLASFVPVNSAEENEELRAYTQHLEKLYTLCWLCDLHVQRCLFDQDAVLRSSYPPPIHPVSSPDSKNIDFNSHSSPKATYWLFLGSVLALLTLLICSIYDALPLISQHEYFLTKTNDLMTHLPQSQVALVVGFLTGTAGVVLTGKDRWSPNDAFFILLWVVLQIVYSNQMLDGFITTNRQFCLKPLFTFITLLSGIFIFKRIRQLQPISPERKRVTTFKLNQPSVTLSNESTKYSPSSSKTPSIICNKTAEDLLTPLDASFNAVHITPPESKKYNLCEDDLAHEFEISTKSKCNPLVRPARFTPPSVTHASWVAGGFWSIPGPNSSNSQKEGTAIKFAMAGFQTSGLFTPPPSVNGSQTSQRTCFAGSVSSNYDHRSCSASSVHSWPPSLQTNSIKNRNAFSPKTSPLNSFRNCGSVYSARSATSSLVSSDIVPTTVKNNSPKLNWCWRLVYFSVGCSALGNVLFLAYLAKPYFQLINVKS